MPAQMKGPPAGAALSEHSTSEQTADNTEPNRKQAAAPSWRDLLKSHPAADEFELMIGDELVALGDPKAIMLLISVTIMGRGAP
jgi:hypothetical protein